MGCEGSGEAQFGWFGFIAERPGVVRWLKWGSVLQVFGISLIGGVEGAQLDGVELSHDPNAYNMTQLCHS